MSAGYKTPTAQRTPKRSQLDGKCVCQICTCGRDRCPPKSTHVDPSHFDTTNQKTYQKWALQRTPDMRPYEPRLNFGTVSYVTSYGKDFTPQKAIGQVTFKPQDTYYPHPFIGETEYHRKFQKIDQYATPLKQQYNYAPKPADKNLFNSTYNISFKPQPLSKSQIIRPEENHLTANQVQFQKKSAYQEEFTPQKPIRTQAYKYPSQAGITGGVSFWKESTSKQDYPLYDPQTYRKAECPVRRLPKQPSTSPNKHLIYSAAKDAWE